MGQSQKKKKHKKIEWYTTAVADLFLAWLCLAWLLHFELQYFIFWIFASAFIVKVFLLFFFFFVFSHFAFGHSGVEFINSIVALSFPLSNNEMKDLKIEKYKSFRLLLVTEWVVIAIAAAFSLKSFPRILCSPSENRRISWHCSKWFKLLIWKDFVCISFIFYMFFVTWLLLLPVSVVFFLLYYILQFAVSTLSHSISLSFLFSLYFSRFFFANFKSAISKCTWFPRIVLLIELSNTNTRLLGASKSSEFSFRQKMRGSRSQNVFVWERLAEIMLKYWMESRRIRIGTISMVKWSACKLFVSEIEFQINFPK